ncbi:MAG: DnaD domain protein [Solobacterium sp.]|nr:DnaD domain protein [Solobacterium sp.]
MKKWYEQHYVNHRDWILENLELLHMSEQEALLVLMIDFLNANQMEITMDLLQKKTGLKKEDLDSVISLLCARNYLEIRASKKEVRFCLDGLFEVDIAKDANVLDSSIFDAFESEFGRPLSQKEMEKIGDWNRIYDRKLLLYALREASAYQKLSVGYIESILTNWKQKGYSVAEIEAGKGNES